MYNHQHVQPPSHTHTHTHTSLGLYYIYAAKRGASRKQQSDANRPQQPGMENGMSSETKNSPDTQPTSSLVSSLYAVRDSLKT